MLARSERRLQVGVAHVGLPREPAARVALEVVLLEHLAALGNLRRQVAADGGLRRPEASRQHVHVQLDPVDLRAAPHRPPERVIRIGRDLRRTEFAEIRPEMRARDAVRREEEGVRAFMSLNIPSSLVVYW